MTPLLRLSNPGKGLRCKLESEGETLTKFRIHTFSCSINVNVWHVMPVAEVAELSDEVGTGPYGVKLRATTTRRADNYKYHQLGQNLSRP